MEAGDSSTRQSGIPSASSLDHYERRPREQQQQQRIDTSFRDGPAAMATAALISPSASGYHRDQHHSSSASSYSSGYPHSAPVTSIPGMISPVDARRPTDESESNNHRQSLPSLPSISEVMGTKPGAFQPVPAPAAPPPLTQTLPSPFPTAAPRPFGDEKNQSPRQLHPPTSSYQRPDHLPSLSDPSRPGSLRDHRSIPPLNTFSAHHHSPTHGHDQRAADRAHAQPPLSAGHREEPPHRLPGLYGQTGQLPPGQLPLSAYPVSPRHNGPPTLPSPYEAQQRPPYAGDSSPEYMHQHQRLPDYKAALDTRFESWAYQDALLIIGNTCRTGYNFAEAYGAAAREQNGSQPIPSRMPTENEVNSLLNSLVMALKKLEDVREMVHHNKNNERARKSEEDTPMYDDGMKSGYSLNEVKKRRGRAAPPGRCHSCNRIDTPEWRRGPDGARTLCNACGLHYAKLERKRQMDQRSIRPKPSEDRS
ncbi:hypothetical protein QBC35DRAFT_291700 [Podospora australis]|uniref:GATA-type domain-containing protein n=1 Tax=Podospora australis TaxID=1536484 RepID=A0AAN7ALY0_9PEZI|nr:hypothetical protein QBC35DRAFT_291700 [Podospora australis]